MNPLAVELGTEAGVGGLLVFIVRAGDLFRIGIFRLHPYTIRA